MSGLKQSVWIFLIWIAVLSNQISVSFFGIDIEKLCPIGNKAPFYTLSFATTKMFIFVLVVVSNQRKVYFLKD